MNCLGFQCISHKLVTLGKICDLTVTFRPRDEPRAGKANSRADIDSTRLRLDRRESGKVSYRLRGILDGDENAIGQTLLEGHPKRNGVPLRNSKLARTKVGIVNIE